MNRKRFFFRIVLIPMTAFCLLMTGCSRENKETPSTPEPVTEIVTTPQPVMSTDAAAAIPDLSTPEPTAVATPEITPIPEPVTVMLYYNGQEVTSLSFMSSSVFQLQAVTSNGTGGGTWTSSDASSASVDENGVVTCWKVGTPRITYTLGEISASCDLSITEPRVAIYFAGQVKTDITLNNTWGFEIQLVSVVSPEGSAVTWSSDDTSVASVNETGKVVAHKMGSALIHCKCGTADASCWIRVTEVPPAQYAATPDPSDNTPRIVITYVGVAKPDMMMAVGDTLSMGYTLYNIDYSTAKVTWKVSDPAYASVDKNGVLTAIKPTFNAFPGRNYITLTATCGDCTYDTAVFIKEEW